ncbi:MULTISPECIES: metallophosphoesterase [Thermoactinomyces]|jgi:exonuclease SbcD|uniref:Metallophosphoesterase family protein n=1 Tax=Thermoactinomyces daqus TaxID=1329516 RepID=A0A7W1X907_9BACL|nr:MULTISPECIES: metallophosphoesterase [Thermoactinomyces]MBA4542242.1 metallophosphoesterase family protein [Thermoactinomyces daqus]MBH8598307.1 metallophosphoesterase family protein [Thermoactinomyces sp. CICC 10523]MBH8604430.1 metallophosphoesterase family protein [Thermoactinomyces sp. CICC 10522]MBH8607570.1 metallophosphoesterase family protein [Thermoactinomyces sp. CICC 10521]
MRILYMTDTHIRGTSPRSRTDQFEQTIRLKLEEVIQIAEREQVDFILHGGDVFDRPNLSPAVVREFARLFRQFPAPVYAIAGNHDIYGHNPATTPRTMLGLLDAFGVIRLISGDEKVKLEKDGLVIQLSGQPFHYDLDKRDPKADYHVQNEMEADYCIHMVHGMLVDRALPDGVPHTMIHDAWSDDVDILLTGHYHAGFPVQHRDGKYIVNPGALARINNHPSEIRRMPQVVLLELGRDVDVRFIPLTCAKRGDEVLDRSYLEKAAYRQEQLTSFVQQVRSAADFQAIDVLDIIDEISRMNDVEDEVKFEAQRRIAIEQEAGGESGH